VSDPSTVPEGWVADCFGAIANIEMGQSPPGDTYNVEKSGMPLINGPTEFRERYPVKLQWTSKPTKLCRKGDILLCVRGSSTGRINVADDDYCIGRGVAAIRARDNSGSTPYLEYLLKYCTDLILAKTGGSTFPNVDKRSLASIEVLIAPNQEQHKIADILSTWDEAIEQQTQLLELKRERKRSLMQQLLTGKVRFKEFEGLEWKAYTFNELAKQRSRKFDPQDVGETRRCIELEHIEQGTGQLLGWVDSSQQAKYVPAKV
jgi:type I restriction enzyme S subunit